MTFNYDLSRMQSALEQGTVSYEEAQDGRNRRKMKELEKYTNLYKNQMYKESMSPIGCLNLVGDESELVLLEQTITVHLQKQVVDHFVKIGHFNAEDAYRIRVPLSEDEVV